MSDLQAKELYGVYADALSAKPATPWEHLSVAKQRAWAAAQSYAAEVEHVAELQKEIREQAQQIEDEQARCARLEDEADELHARALAGMEKRVAAWTIARIGERSMNRRERALRVLEEAMELAQAEGVATDMVARLFTHVYSRPAGGPLREAAALAFVLLGWCAAADVELYRLAVDEIARNDARLDADIQRSLLRKRDAGLVYAESEVTQ